MKKKYRYPRDSTEKKYLPQARELSKPDRNTLAVDFVDLEKHDDRLKNAIQEQIYRLYPYLCNSVKNFVKDQNIPLTAESNDKSQQQFANKEFYVAFENISNSTK